MFPGNEFRKEMEPAASWGLRELSMFDGNRAAGGTGATMLLFGPSGETVDLKVRATHPPLVTATVSFSQRIV
jgi:hypothetical protein